MCRRKMVQWVTRQVQAGRPRLLAVMAMGLLGGAAQAATYTLPGSLPTGCSSASSTSVTCSSLSLAWDDNLVVSNANLTLTVTNTLTVGGNNNLNISGSVSGFSIQAKTVTGSNNINLKGNLNATTSLTLSSNTNSITGNISAGGNVSLGGVVTGSLTTTGTLTTQWATTITGDISATGVSSGGGSTYGGNVTATSGDVISGSSDKIAGNVSAATGLVTLKSANTSVGGNVVAKNMVTLESGVVVSGSVTSTNDEVVLKSSGSSVGAGINAKKKVTLGSGTTVTGKVVTDDEVVLESSSSKVIGNIVAKKKVTLGSSTAVTGDVTSTIGDVELKSSSSSISQCVTVASGQTIKLDSGTTVGGVCCLSGSTCGTSCVVNNSGGAAPAVCAAAPVSPSCVVDDFASGALNTALWNSAAVSGTFKPIVVDVGGQKRIRLTQAVGNQSTMLQLKKWFPGAGNKIIVTFVYYVYGGSGADGATVVFSDAGVTPAPGGFGGSLGYAQRGTINGFAGGWLGIGLDEFGNYPTVGGYPTGWLNPVVGVGQSTSRQRNNVSVRGSGNGIVGYRLLANTGTLSPVLWSKSNTASTLQKFRISIDHSNNTNAYVTVERDATGSGSYVTVVPKFDAKAAPGQAAVPSNWLVSFTGSTGGSHNNHEIANLSICATNVTDPGGSVTASNFECMDGSLPESSYVNRLVTPSGRNPIYTKLARTAFNLRVVPIKTDGTIELAAPYENTQVEVFDVGTGTEPACSALNISNRLAGPVPINFLRSSDNLTVNKAVTKARCRVTYTDPTSGSVTHGCASDLFAVRPGAVALTVTSATAAGPSAGATPTVKAGTNFTLRATTSTSSSDAYSGTLAQNSGAMTAQNTANDAAKANGGTVGALTPASLVANAAPVTATYGEVGYLYLAAGAYRDTSFTAADGSTDCVSGNTSVTLSSGKYGCVIGNTAEVRLGRFIPDHFDVTVANNGSLQTACGSNFTYTGQPMTYSTAPRLTIKAMNGLATPSVTQNYSGVFQKLNAANVVITSPTADATQLGKDGTTKTALTATMSTGTLPGFTDSPAVFTSGTMTYTLKADDSFSYTRNANGLVAPYTSALWLPVASVIDSDAVAGTGLPTLKPTGVDLRYGRARMFNAFGSELLDLPVPFRAEYLATSAGVWQLNSGDTCTNPSLTKTTVAGTADITSHTCALESGDNSGIGCAAALTSAQTNRGYLESGVTGTDSAGAAGFAGNFNLWLKAPGAGHQGAIDITANVDTWLEYNWSGAVGDPKSRVTFGVYNAKSPIIYRRENY